MDGMSQLSPSEHPFEGTAQAQGLLPNFLIIGAAKSGTTSLYHYLKDHPDIFMSSVKETNFFLGDGKTAAEEIGLDGKSRSLTRIATLADYSALFQNAVQEKARGEASPKYLYYPGVAQRIKEVIPNTKIIVILRHPVDRAYSAFLHHLREGEEEYTDFAAVLREEPNRIERGIDPKYHYRNRGFYFKQLSPYYDAFGAEKVQVYLYEDLRKEPLSLMRHLFGVLGVDPAFEPNMGTEHNISGVPKNQLLHKVYGFLKSDRNVVKELGKRVLPGTLRQQLKGRIVGSLQKNNLIKPSLPPEIRTNLIRGYREDIVQLQSLIGRDLTHWLE